MSKKTVPFNRAFIADLVAKVPTPFHIYDEQGMRENARKLYGAFSWISGEASRPYRNYFAVKALPNPHIMKVLKEEGLGFDCSSIAELELCARIGVRGEDIFFTSNNTKHEEYVRARELGAIINLDDITHLEYLEKHAGLPDILCFRYNPGPLREGNAIIGKPEEAKYGLTRDQIFEAYAVASQKGVKRFALHTMVASNELQAGYFVETARMLFELALEIQAKTGVVLEFVNIGGGIGIPYKPEQDAVDISFVSKGIQDLHHKMLANTPLSCMGLVSENGRCIVGPFGYLVSTAIHHKHIYREYVGLDSCMANLMRPGMYGSYHHITVLGKENAPCDQVYDVVGSLCENNDKFAVQRSLPRIEEGDFVVIHDTGAHGHAMGFNYNGKLRSAEVMLQADGSTRLIRRAETIDDLFATLDFTSL